MCNWSHESMKSQRTKLGKQMTEFVYGIAEPRKKNDQELHPQSRTTSYLYETNLVNGGSAVCPPDELAPSLKGAEKVSRGGIKHVLLAWLRCRHGDVLRLEYCPFSSLQRNRTTCINATVHVTPGSRMIRHQEWNINT